jgi:hypothetical protein
MDQTLQAATAKPKSAPLVMVPQWNLLNGTEGEG